jgi:hypothetical protein
MIEVNNIQIIEGMPGRAARYQCAIRLIDPDQGTHQSELGLPLWNYDKGIWFEAQYLGKLIERAERVITEVLCS